MAEGNVVYPEETKPPFRGRHGAGAQGIPAAVRDPRHPVVCMDEMSKQLVAEASEKLPVRPGSPEKYDAHYLRRGECTVWMFGEPLSGWRTVVVTKRRTTLDWAKQVRAGEPTALPGCGKHHAGVRQLEHPQR